METKPWYQSKTVWIAVVAVLISTYETFKVTLAPALGFVVPNIPEWIYALLAAAGIYTRVTATSTLTK